MSADRATTVFAAWVVVGFIVSAVLVPERGPSAGFRIALLWPFYLAIWCVVAVRDFGRDVRKMWGGHV